MDTKKLRQKILDLAIRGKLVLQDPNDEPASVLIEKVRVEKERLIKEKKIKRDKNESYIYRSDKSYYEKFADGTVKCIDEEIPFEIPESWGILRFDDFCFLKAGQFVSAQDIDIKYNQQLHPCYGGNGLRGYVKTYTHDGEFLLIGRQGALCGNVNYVSGRFHATEHAVVVQNFGSCINNKWLYYTLEAMNLNQYSAGAAQPGLNVGFLNKLRISIPPRIEQNRIVEKIEYTFALIDTINTDKEDLFQFVQTTKSKILDLAIRGKLVPQDPNDEPASTLLGCIKAEHPESKKRVSKTSDNSHYTFNIPKTWEWTTIGDITEHNTGKILDKGRNTGSLYKYITTSNLYWDYFLLDDLKEMPFEENELSKYSAIKGDLLICEGGDGGRSAIWNKDIPICFQNHIHRVRPFSGIRSRYIYFFMRYSSLNGYINYYKKGIGIQSLSGNSLSSIRLPLPPIPEQDRIINKIDDIFTSLDKITNSIKA